MAENVADLLEVRSSNGTLFLDVDGFVMTVDLAEPIDEASDHLLSIRQFDLPEYQATYGEMSDAFDILDVGYWYMKRDEENIPVRTYEPPAYDWRERDEL